MPRVRSHDLELWMEHAPRAHIQHLGDARPEPRDVKDPRGVVGDMARATRPAFPRSFLLAAARGLPPR